MNPQHARFALQGFLVAAVLGTALAAGPLVGPATAGDLADLETSLRLVPKDVAFYSSSMRLKEQVEIVGESRAWARLMEMPSVKQGLDLYEEQSEDPESPAAQFQQYMQSPQMQDLVGLLKEMFAEDVFCFGDQQYSKLIRLVQEVSNTVQYGSMLAELSGESGDLGPEELQAALLLDALAGNLDAIEFPTTVVGFKIDDVKQAERNLSYLGMVVGMACSFTVPELNGAFDRTDIAGNDFLVLTLTGDMIPWEEVPMDELEEIEFEPGQAEKVIGKAKEMTLVIAVGIRDDYLLASVGPSTDCLANLGSGELLIERP